MRRGWVRYGFIAHTVARSGRSPYDCRNDEMMFKRLKLRHIHFVSRLFFAQFVVALLKKYACWQSVA